MKQNNLALTITVSLCLLLLTGCGGSGKPKLTGVAVTPATASVQAGATQQFAAKASYSDGTTTDVSVSATWNSSSTTVATISTMGVATGLAAGTSNITATLQGVVSPAVLLTVTAAPQLQSISVSPANPSVANPGTQQFTATGTYLAGGATSTKDITGQVAWASSNLLVGTIVSSGLATSVAPGTSTISATLGSVSGSTVLTVTGPPVAVAFKVTPTAATIATGSTATFVAQELWSDGTLHVPASTVTWTSGTTSVAKVVLVGTGTSTANLVALAVGSSVITASEANFPPVNSNLTVQAATARFAFNADNGFNVSQGGTGTLAEWSVDTTTGAFTTIAATVQVYQLQQIIVHPSGHFFYAIDVNNNFVQYDVNSTTGAVTRDTNLPVPTTNGLGVSKAAIDPTGRFVYLVNAPTVTGISASLYSFSIDQGTGALTSIGTNPMTANLVNPTDIEIDRTGAYAYVVDGGTSAANFTGSTPGNIYQYQIDPVAGTLTPLSTASVATGVAPFFAAIDPSNTYLYTANLVDVSLSVYKIGIGGLLSQVGTPTVISGAQEPFDLTIEPSGKYLYVGDFNGGTLYGFVLGPNGTIGAGTPGSPYPVGGNIPSPQPWGITIDPTGTLLAVDNVSANLLSVFQLNPMNGGLTAAPDVPTGGLPFYLSFYTAMSGQ